MLVSIGGKKINVATELIERGLIGEAKAIKNKSNSASSMVVGNLSNLASINKVIDMYIDVESRMVFPLGQIEDDIKYTAIAQYIINEADEDCDRLLITVSDGINIKLDSKSVVKLQYGGWNIKEVENELVDKEIDIAYYEGKNGYEEYAWVLERLLSKQSLDGYYIKFMGDFYASLGGDIDKVKAKVRGLLSKNKLLKSPTLNCLVNVENDVIDQLILTPTGIIQTEDEVKTYEEVNGEVVLVSKPGSINGFDIRTVRYQDEELARTNDKTIEKFRVMDAIMLLVGAIFNKDLYNARWVALTDGKIAVVNINNKIYATTYNEYTEPYIIHQNAKLIGLEDGLIYIENRHDIGYGVIKRSVYTMDIKNDFDMELYSVDIYV